jgi:hypothetical protein
MGDHTESLEFDFVAIGFKSAVCGSEPLADPTGQVEAKIVG